MDFHHLEAFEVTALQSIAATERSICAVSIGKEMTGTTTDVTIN